MGVGELKGNQLGVEGDCGNLSFDQIPFPAPRLRRWGRSYITGTLLRSKARTG